MPSIVIAAHNEATVIGQSLDTLLAATAPGEFDVTVVANGCTDDTAKIAAVRAGVRVIDLPTPGKTAALNAGDDVAVGYPRVYLDADIAISAADIRALCDALVAPTAEPGARLLATTARREVDVSRSPMLVRAYHAVNARLPVFRHALFGRGVIVLSAEGRGRFERFPEVVADDLFLDSLFSVEEKREIESVRTWIAAPRRTRDLVRRLVRVRRGNASMRAAIPDRSDFSGAGRGRARMSWLFDVVLPNPALIPAAACYVAITAAVAILAMRPQRQGTVWGRDESSRTNDGESRGTSAAAG